jgi:DNA polymerase III subunit gamma/tau
MSTQEHVSETLRSAVARGRVAHAYLFSGPRGVGKTTAARVLAMALNCPHREDDGEPCGECESCTRIWAGRTSLDVVEIDAASNRGVEDARELRERAMYAPTEEGRYKVYIIDEAHMLTREAWNALLKILEEPPPRVIFVFATTEPQKIQQTAAPILSRTQRFDFRRLGVPAIVDRLAQVLAAEGVETDQQALLLLARRADGGMRDALSLLDQALSFTERTLRSEDVQRILGLVSDEVYLELFGVIAEGRVGDVFRFVQDVVDAGHDLSEFYRGLADAVRTLLVIRFDGAEAAPVRDDLRPLWLERAETFSTGDLLRMLSRLAELDADGRFRKSSNPRVLLEALLLKFAHLPRTVEIEELIRAAGGAGAQEPRGEQRSPPENRARPARQDTEPASAPGAARRRPPAPGPTQGPPTPESGPPAPPPPSTEPGPPGPGAEETASETPSRGAAATPDVALREIIRSGDVELSGVLVPLLRSARVTESDPGNVEISLPGLGFDRLERDPGTRRALEVALGERLGRAIRIEVRDSTAVEKERLTPEKLRQQQVSQLTGEEPALDRAVKEWDLEMLD